MTVSVVVLLVLSAGAAVAADLVARRRVAAQPVAYDLGAEATIMAALDHDPHLAGAAVAAGLRAEHFVDDHHRDRFAVLTGTEALPGRHDGQDAGRSGGRPDDDNDAVVVVKVTEVAGTEVAGTEVAGTGDSVALPDRLAGAVASVVACGEDRAMYPGRAAATATGDPDRPLRRPSPSRSVGRLAVVAAAFAGFAAAVTGRVDGWTAVALALWFTTGVVLSLVDLDTLLLDLPGYAVGYGASWVAAAAVGGVTGVGVGLAAGLAVAGLMWVVSATFSRLRGRDSLGFGDVILVVSTVGVPVAAAGAAGEPLLLTVLAATSWGMMTLAVGGVAGLAVWAAEARRSGRGAATPFAFGPGLVAGAAIAWVLL